MLKSGEDQPPNHNPSVAALLGGVIFASVLALTTLAGRAQVQDLPRGEATRLRTSTLAASQVSSATEAATSGPTPTTTASPTATAEPTATTPPTRTPEPTVTPTPSATLTAEPTATSTAPPTSTLEPTGTSTPTATRTPSRTPIPTITSSPTSRAPEPTATEPPPPARPSPLPVTAEDHYWLERPIGPDATDAVAHFYPYGSTANGTYQVHHGVEFVNPMNTPIRAVAPGTVVFAGSDGAGGLGPMPNFYGQAVVVRLDRDYHGLPAFTLYGHVERWLVNLGQHVEAGQVIAQVGMTGVALGPHLHFEVRVGENDYWHTRNPELWLKPFPGFGTIAGRIVDETGMPIGGRHPVLLYKADTPDKYWRETETYGRGVNPDDGWQENFLFGDVPAGDYLVRVKVGDQVYSKPVGVEDGKTVFVFPQAAE